MNRTTHMTALALLLGAGIVGCGTGGSSYVVSQPPPDSPAVTAIRTTIDAINATAGGPVATQRALLDELAAPEHAEAQRRCPEASNTLAFEPTYRDLRTPSDTGQDAYLLPTYISIYTGDRITGSDLATMQLWIIDGAARTSALCVS